MTRKHMYMCDFCGKSIEKPETSPNWVAIISQDYGLTLELSIENEEPICLDSHKGRFDFCSPEHLANKLLQLKNEAEKGKKQDTE